MSKPNANWAWDQGPIGRLIKIAHVTLRRELEEQLKEVGLTYSQWSALAVISHFDGITSSELELILMIERPSVTSLINGMVSKGLVVRREDPDDARYKHIYLTDDGKMMADQTQHFTRIVEDRVKAGFSLEEFETLRELLIKMIGLFKKR
jgi:MarR family transcriptional regulator, transcriptional regulator for hemolysin